MAGKGSKRRPTNESAYRNNFDRIFNHQPEEQPPLTDYILRRAAAAYQQNNGLLPLDMAQALTNAGLVIEDVINYIEENNLG